MVYPLLDRGSAALPDPTLTRELRAFLAQVEAPLVLADSSLDLTLLVRVLCGFDQPDLPTPPYRSMLITFGDVQMRVEDYFENHLQARARRHHAMVDAEALRWAFEAAIGQGPLETERACRSNDRPKNGDICPQAYLIPNGRPENSR